MTDKERVNRALVWFLWTWTVIAILALTALALFVLSAPLAIVVPPLALAGVIVYVLNPVVRRLERRGLPRILGASAAYVVLLAGVVAAGRLLAPVIAEQVTMLAETAPDMAVNIQEATNAQLSRLGIDAELTLDPESEQVRDAARQYLLGGVTRAQLGDVLAGAGSVARTILHWAVLLLLGPVLAFYLLYDLPNVLDGMRRIVPPSHRDEVVGVVQGIAGRVGGYFRGQLLVATFVGVATSIGLAFLGLPFWALVGLVTGIFNLVPLIGPFVGGAVGVAVALTAGTGVTQALWVVVIMTVVQQVDNHVISPNVMSRTVELHPITVMLGLLVAGTLYGILGMLVAVPVIAAIKLVLLHLLATRAPWATDDLPTPATAGLRHRSVTTATSDAEASPEDAGTPA